RKPSMFLTEMFGNSIAETEPFSSHTNIDVFSGEDSVPPTAIPSKILKDNIYTLSASQITCYLNCPLDFYYKHVLCIPQTEGASASYGTAIHAGIQYIGAQRLLGHMPAYEDVLAIVESKLPKRGFASDGTKQKNYETYAESTKRMYER